MPLKVKTSVDGSGFAAGLKRMEEDAANFGKNLSSKISGNFGQAIMSVVPGLTSAIAGVFAADKIKAALLEFAKKGEEIEFGAIRLNVNQETYQRVDNVMKEIGQTTDTAAVAFDKLAQSMTKIEEGRDTGGELRVALAQLGIGIDDLAAKDPQAVFFKIAAGMKGIRPTQEQVSALREVFGRMGDNLLPAFQLGFDSFFAGGGIIKDSDLDNIKAYNAELRNYKAAARGFWHNLGNFTFGFAKGLLISANPAAMVQAGLLNEAETAWEKSEAEARNKENKKNIEMLRQKAVLEQIAAVRQKMDKADRTKAEAIEHETRALIERNRLAAMTPEARRIEMLKEIKSLEGELRYGAFDSETEAAEKRKRIAEIQGEMALLAKPKPMHEALSHMGNQAIGGIMLGHDRLNDIAGHARRSAEHLGSIDKKIPAQRQGRAPHQEFP